MTPNHTKSQFRIAVLMGLLHSLCFVLSFPPVGLWGAAFLALPPLYFVTISTDRPWRSALGVFLGAAPAWAILHAWIIDVTAPGYPGLVALMCAYPTLFVALGARAMQTRLSDSLAGRWLVLPVLWTGLEFLRGQIAFDGYPWYLLGQALVLGPDAIEPTRLGMAAQHVGGYGLTLLVASTSSIASSPLLWERTGAPAYRVTLVVLRGALCVIAWSLTVASIMAVQRRAGVDAPNAGALRLGIVQTNVAQDNKIGWTPAQQVEDFGRFLDLTREAAALHSDPGLLVWPETMFPGMTLDPEATAIERDANLVFSEIGVSSTVFIDSLMSLHRDLASPMLVGAIGYDNLTAIDPNSDEFIVADAKYNSVFHLAGGSVAPTRYDKIHLTPFGEVMPYISRFDWLEDALLAIGAGGMSFDLDAGRQPVRFEVGDARIVTPICFETTMPNVMRRLVGGGDDRANLVIQLSNDGWFGESEGGRKMHALIARLRAIELGVPVARVVNTGVSCVFTSEGRRLSLLARIEDERPSGAPYLPTNQAGVGMVDVPLRTHTTLYSRTGDVIGWACFGATLVFGCWAGCTGVARRREKRRPLEETE